jgi:putative ABC transport system permease protein
MSVRFLPLLWAGLWRKPTRSIYTLISITVAFLLVGIMTGVGASVAQMIANAEADMIMVSSRFGASMPIAYADQIAQLDGVSKIAIGAGIGGTYQTPDKRVGINMTDARIVAVEPAFGISPELFAKLESVRNGVIINQNTADRLGWKEGETYPVETNRQNIEGNRVWTFKVVAILPEDEDRPGGGLAVGNYNYLNEGRADEKNEINGISLRVDDSEQAPTTSAAIERLFANSPTPVSATPLRTLIEQSIRGVLDLQFVIYSVSAAALFMILFLTGNVLAQSVRERIPEFAVMKTIGFSDRAVLSLVLAEAAALCLVGAILGLVAAKIIPALLQTVLPGGPRPVINLGVVVFSLAAAVVVAAISGLPAAWRVRRISIADALGGR